MKKHIKKEFVLRYLILKIQDEQYQFNKKLPSIRFLANKFKISNKTVQNIYEELKKLNLIKSVNRVGYVCNEEYIFNLWRTRKEYYTQLDKLITEKATDELKQQLKIKGEWVLKYLNSSNQNLAWISLAKFNFAFDWKDVNLSIKKFLTYYGYPITKVSLKIKGLPINKCSIFSQYFKFWSNGIIYEEINFYSFNKLVTKLYFYQPNNKFVKEINFSIL